MGFGFQATLGLKRFRTHVDAGDCDNSPLERDLSYKRSKIAQYDLRDVYYVDELALFHRMAPASTVAATPMQGRKVAKDHLSVLAYVDADGLEKFE